MGFIENIKNTFLFAPMREFISLPESEGISCEQVFIETSDRERLHGYFFPAKQETKKTVIYLHGNAQNVSAWYPACVEIQKYIQVNFLLVDYRGYGQSTGSPTMKGVILDAQAMYKYLIDSGFKPEDISVYGRSIGGAVALELAVREKVKSAVIQSSFSSIEQIAKDLYPFIPSYLAKSKHFNSQDLIRQINIPVLISHGSHDELISINHAYGLYESANEPKKFIILKGASHNEISPYFTEEYFEELRKLFF